MKKWLTATLAIAFSAALVGCGGSGGSGGGSGTSGAAGSGSSASQSSGSASAPSSSQAPKNDLLAKVMKTHQVRLAESAFAPEDFQDPQTKQWTGFDIYILKGFAQSLGAKLVIDPMSFASSIQAVASKRDALTIDIYKNAKRAKVLDFSRPMLNYNDVVAVRAKNPKVQSATISALTGKTIGAVIGSAEVAEVKKVPKVHKKLFNTVAESFLALSSGRIAADFQPGADVEWAIHKNPSLGIKLLGPVPKSIAPPIKNLRGYYGVPKGSYSTRFLAKLNTYLKKIECNGQEQKIIAKFGFTNKVFLKGLCSASN